MEAEGVFGSSPPAGSSDNSCLLINPQIDKARRISTGMMKIEVMGQQGEGVKVGTTHRTGSLDATSPGEKSRVSLRKHLLLEKKLGTLQVPPVPPNSASCNTPEMDSPDVIKELSDLTSSRVRSSSDSDSNRYLNKPSPRLAPIASCEIVTEDRGDWIEDSDDDDLDRKKRVRIGGVTEEEITTDSSVPSSPKLFVSSPTSTMSPIKPILVTPSTSSPHRPTKFDVPSMRIPEANLLDHTSLSPGSSPRVKRPMSPRLSPVGSPSMVPKRAPSPISHSLSSPSVVVNKDLQSQFQLQPQYSWPRGSVVSWSGAMMKRPSNADSDLVGTTPRSSLTKSEIEGSPPCRPKAGAVVTSSRASKRRSSNTAAALAFAVATAGSANPPSPPGKQQGKLRAESGNFLEKRLSVICTAATMRVLNVVRHWVYKFSEDIEADPKLKFEMEGLLEDLVCNQSLIPQDHKAALQIMMHLKTNSLTEQKPDITAILTPAVVPSKENFDTLSALDISEQLTYIDHQIFRAIRSEELLMQAWMKEQKNQKATHVLLVSKRFNEVSRLVVSEIVRRGDIADRVACIEKWAAIADICRCLHNYNGVLQICAAFVNSSVYRLNKTWEKLSKPTKMMIDKLQCLVSSDGRFKNMREALHRCDPPCIPYLGMYLTDLSFIEEGTSNFTDGLVNFCKMRMIAHVIREIQQYQQTPYRIEHNEKACDYLLDPTRQLDDEKTYMLSLSLEPRPSIATINPPQSDHRGRKSSAAT